MVGLMPPNAIADGDVEVIVNPPVPVNELRSESELTTNVPAKSLVEDAAATVGEP